MNKLDERFIDIEVSDTTTNLTAASTNITAAQCTGRTIIANSGRTTNLSTAVLPNATVGLVCHFNIVDSGGIELDPDTGDELIVEGTGLGANTNLICKTMGTRLTISCSVAGKWNVVASNTARSAIDILDEDKSTSSTSFVSMGVTFSLICGQSGKIDVEATACFQNNTSSTEAYFNINESAVPSNIFAGRISTVNGSSNYLFAFTKTYTNLTPGTTYTFTLQWKVGSGTVRCEPVSYPNDFYCIMKGKTS